MHIRFAQPADTEQIIGLWQQCFGDSPAFISFYLQHHPFSENTLLLALEGDVVLSMLSLLPACFLYQDQQLPVRYVYAVGTDIRFRGQGLSTALLDSAAQICRENNEAGLFLIPASQSLFSFYGARGFYNAFGRRRRFFRCAGAFWAGISPLSSGMPRRLAMPYWQPGPQAAARWGSIKAIRRWGMRFTSRMRETV